MLFAIVFVFEKKNLMPSKCPNFSGLDSLLQLSYYLQTVNFVLIDSLGLKLAHRAHHVFLPQLTEN